MTSISQPDGPSLRIQASAWYWWAPLVAIVLVVTIAGTFIWVGLRAEREERRTALVNDSLWMEQNLRFHLESTENVLAQLGGQFNAGQGNLSEAQNDRVRTLLQGDSGLVALLWIDATRAEVTTLPASAAPVMLASDHDIAIQRARALSRPTYSRPFVQADGSYAMEVVIPIFGGSDFVGHVVGIYSLSRLIEKHVPWWFAERYRLVLTDGASQELAGTTLANPGEASPLFQVSLDQIGGLGLNVNANPGSTRVMPAVVVLALVVLTFLVAWSLWVLRNHVLRLQSAEAALRREHAFRLAMENSALVGLCARDMTGRITHVNTAFCRLIDWPAEALIGSTPPTPYWQNQSSASSGSEGQQIRETRLVQRSGEAIDVLVYEAPLVDADGRQTGWMGSVLDITQRKRAEALARSQQERLEATARLAGMGEMASTLAHEINQPLSAVTSYSAGCLNALRNGRYNEQQFLDVLGKINTQAQRAGRIVHRIYDFVKRSESRREATDLNATLSEAVALLETDAQRRHVRVQFELATGLPIVQTDRTMIEQVIINLLRNGMDAMGETAEAQRQLVVRSEYLPEEALVRLSVRDFGSGVPAQIADRLFDSFFTTKREGMGLGLKICRSVAEQHNGRLWFEPAEGGGTTFYLQLPLGEERSSKLERPA